jgi:lipopolysaccharide biosynthesis glycosyltransferase
MRAVVTIAIGDAFRDMAALTHPSIAAYARRVRADFISITHAEGSPYTAKMRISELLWIYDRILYLDTDILVRPECPDLFDLVPPDQFGVWLASTDNRGFGPMIAGVQAARGDIGWREPYFNSGVMVVSRMHRPAFNKRLEYADEMPDQTLLNYRVQKLKFPIFDLGHRFNHTGVADTVADRADSFIIHYAGVGGGNKQARLDAITTDMRRFGMRVPG